MQIFNIYILFSAYNKFSHHAELQIQNILILTGASSMLVSIKKFLFFPDLEVLLTVTSHYSSAIHLYLEIFITQLSELLAVSHSHFGPVRCRT